MKKSVSYWCFRGKTYAEAFRIAKEQGFDGVEITLDEQGEVTMESTDEDILRIRAEAEKAGCEIFSVATARLWQYSLTDNDVNLRREGMRIARRTLEIASLLGADTVLIVPGVVNRDTPYDVVWERATAAIRELIPHAEKCGVRMGIENVGNFFLLSPMEMRDFIDSFQSPWVGAYFDVGNVVGKVGFPEQWIRILGGRLLKIHFKNYNGIMGIPPEPRGTVEYPRVLQALRDVGYANFCTSELSPEGEDGLGAVRFSAEAYRRIFADENA